MPTVKHRLISTIALLLCGATSVVAQDSDWYIALSAGPDWAGTLKQAGFNGDNICYPTNVCTSEPTGYRWYYDLETDVGRSIDMALGKTMMGFRLELGFSHTSSETKQVFTGISFLDGSPLQSAQDSNYTFTDEASVDGVSINSLMVSAYRDFKVANLGRFIPYAGIGAGLAQVELSDLLYRSEYGCSGDPCDAELPAARYNSHQEVSLSETVFSMHLTAGMDYPLGNGASVGLKFSYRLTGNLKQDAGYLQHPIPDQINTTKISDLDSWSLGFTIKYKIN